MVTLAFFLILKYKHAVFHHSVLCLLWGFNTWLLLCWGSFLLFLIIYVFLSQKDAEFFQILFLCHFRWSWIFLFVCLVFFFLSFCLVQFSCSVVSNSLQPHELQHVRPPCPSPTPKVHPNPRPLSRWCHPTISPSVVPLSSCPQSFPASGSLPMSQLFALGGQSIGVSASTSVLPMNTQDWSPLGSTG